MKLGDYLDILFPNDIKKVQQIYKLIKSKELNSESDIDKYLEKNKSNLKKDIQDTIKMVDSTKKPKKINTKNVSNAIELAQMMAKEPKYNTKKTNTKNISKAIELAQLIAKEPKYVKKTQKDEVLCDVYVPFRNYMNYKFYYIYYIYIPSTYKSGYPLFYGRERSGVKF